MGSAAPVTGKSKRLSCTPYKLFSGVVMAGGEFGEGG